MKKQSPFLFLVFGFVAILFSCTTGNIHDEEAPPANSGGEMTVTLEDALDEMYSLMDELYGPGTRAARPAIAGVETAKSSQFAGRTRTGETVLPENLVYIVNFENDEGFAILGADERMPSVICIAQEGSMTLDDIVYERPKSYWQSLVNIIRQGLPVYFYGEFLYWDEDDGEYYRPGHAWVLDGFTSQMRNITTYYSDGTFMMNLESRYLFHCVYGWNGYCDGFYIEKLFNSEQGPEFREPGVDNMQYTISFNYDRAFAALKYSR